MSIFDKLWNQKEEKRDSLSEEEVLQAFRQACWDLYISNLPEPVIVDANSRKTKKDRLPDEIKDAIPRGFCIDPNTWTTYFNNNDIPKQIADKDEQKKYARSIFQHEDTHFTQVPADGLTEAVLVDSALKGFSDQNILKDKELAHAFAYLTINIMGDLIGDTLLAKEHYGREDFGELTLWREKETIREARNTTQTPSLLWQTLVSTYEKLWDENLGLDNYIQKRNPQAEQAADGLVKILGNDWKDRKTWEDKIRKFASTLEPIIKQTAQQAANQQGKSRYKSGGKKGKGQDRMPVPDDVRTQMGDPTESPLKEKGNGEKISKGGSQGKDQNNGNGAEHIDEQVLDEIYQRNKEAPGNFAGTMAALKKIEPDDALRLMYRARAKELLMSIKEKENQRTERAPSYQTAWNIGDPIVGKGGLELIPSMMASGKPVPGLTTTKRKLQESEGYGRLKMIPDLFIVIDSSGSMGWNPWINPPDARGDFDKAILAAEGAALYAISNGGRVAIINHSAETNVTLQNFTKDIDRIEKAIMVNYGGGTVVPCKDVQKMIKKTQNPLLTCYMSDCDMTNVQGACDDGFAHGINEHDSVAIFNIATGRGSQFANKMKERGAVVYNVDKIEDLAGIIIGEVKKEYNSARGKQDAN